MFMLFKNFFLEVKKSHYLREKFPNAFELHSTPLPMREAAKDVRKRWYSTGEGEADIKMFALARLSMAVPFPEYVLY